MQNEAVTSGKLSKLEDYVFNMVKRHKQNDIRREHK